MPVLVSVFGAALVTLVVVLAVTALRHFHEPPSAPMSTERWLVDHLLHVRGARRVVRALDRYVWGGAMVGVGLVAVLFAAAAVGWILSTVDSDRGFGRFDQSAAEWGSEHATGASTDALRTITHLGASGPLIVIMVVFGLIAVFRSPVHRWAQLGFLLTVGVGITLVNNGLKRLVDRDRPELEHLAGSGGSSFPSGHSAAAAACWAALALVAGRRLPAGSRHWLAAAAAAIAVLVAASRVLLGVHWLTDVVAGVLVGWIWFFVVALIFGGRLQRFGEPAERAATQPVTETTREPV